MELRDLATGLKDVFSGGKLLITEEEFRAAMAVFQNEMAREEVAVKRMTPDVSYAIGVDAARKFKWQGVELDVDFLIKGLSRCVIRGKTPHDRVQTAYIDEPVPKRGEPEAEPGQDDADEGQRE